MSLLTLSGATPIKQSQRIIKSRTSSSGRWYELNSRLEERLIELEAFRKKKHFSINVIELTIDFVYENLGQLFHETRTK